jgi:hypothetical protein
VDHPTALRLHVREHGGDEVHVAEVVDLELAARRLEDALGVIDQDVDASLIAHHGLDGGLDLRRDGDVTGEEAEPVQPVTGEIEAGDAAAVGVQGACERQADAAVHTGEDNDLILRRAHDLSIRQRVA